MTRQKKSPYDELFELSRQIATYASIQQILEWDQETYMPPGAIDFRSSQLELLAGHVHKLRTSSRFSHALGLLIDLESGEIYDDSLSAAEIAALREWRRDHLRAIKLPAAFVKTFARTTATAMHAWSVARKKSDFKQFLPHLEKIVMLSRKKADILGYQEHPYDALLDLYEPEMKVSVIAPLFGRLKIALTELVKEITARGPPKTDFLQGDFPPAKQMEFVQTLLDAMGFETATSRLDQSAHPMCTPVHPQDTRMTTRIHPDNPISNIFSVLHEGGHGLYNSDLDPEKFGSPLGEQVSLGVDESQSRWWENWIGKSVPFWKHFYPSLQKTFPQQLKHVPEEDFIAAVNCVRPSFIRVEADEVTYSLHVLLRFEIEKALIEGSLKVKDVPEAWNEKMRDYLGIRPERDDEGCLQDIHWSMGGIGYFPTYVLGNLYAAQFFEVFEKNHPKWKEQVAKGELAFIRSWLKENIHSHGRQYPPGELVKKVTGKPLSETAFVGYLTKKFSSKE